MFSISSSNKANTVELFHASRKSRERKLLRNLTPCSLRLTPYVRGLELEAMSMNILEGEGRSSKVKVKKYLFCLKPQAQRMRSDPQTSDSSFAMLSA